jgi:chemotaxis protein MotB
MDGTIIIKKKKGGHGHGHHGGAWKVAYADFVTAMMAFFLLMWLLNATTESQRKGLSDYFDPRIPISKVSGGGTDMFKGSSMFAKDQLARNGTGGAGDKEPGNDKSKPKRNEESQRDAQHEVAHKIDAARQPGTLRDSEDQGRERDHDAGSGAEPDTAGQAADGTDGAETKSNGAVQAPEQSEGEALGEKIMQRVQQHAEFQGLDRHLIFKVTEEGLRIEVVDRDGEPMFNTGASDATGRMEALVQVIAEVVRDTGNKVALTGHTDSSRFSASAQYGNWELSTDRAHSARRMLERFGVGRSRIDRVEGQADTTHLVPEAPDDPRNRRIGIIILRGDR